MLCLHLLFLTLQPPHARMPCPTATRRCQKKTCIAPRRLRVLFVVLFCNCGSRGCGVWASRRPASATSSSSPTSINRLGSCLTYLAEQRRCLPRSPQATVTCLDLTAWPRLHRLAQITMATTVLPGYTILPIKTPCPASQVQHPPLR